mgnify:FL=1|tara:strand:+ start:1148 stop:1867 length:720 start_codon:yes stop_codon:yes gene_type:complete
MSSTYAILSVKNSPILNFLLVELKKRNHLPKAIIYDNKNLAKEEIVRYCDRTGYSINELVFSENKFNLSSFRVINHNSLETINLIKKLKINFLVNAGTPRILKKSIIESTSGVLNCHPGILPSFRGCSCVEWAIYKDQPVGNSIHWIDESIDSGPLITTKITKCFRSDKYQDIRKRVYHDGYLLMINTISKLIKTPDFLSSNELKGKLYSGGTYYKPMQNNLLNQVKIKVKNKLYKHQT